MQGLREANYCRILCIGQTVCAKRLYRSNLCGRIANDSFPFKKQGLQMSACDFDLWELGFVFYQTFSTVGS